MGDEWPRYGYLGQPIRENSRKGQVIMGKKKKAKKKAAKKVNRMKQLADAQLDRPVRTTVEAVGSASTRAKTAIANARKKEGMGNSWKPSVDGDAIFGTVISHKMSQASKEGYPPQLVLTLKVDEGAKDVFCNVVLMNCLNAEKVRLQDEIAIVYKGTETSGRRGAKYKNYTLVNASAGTKRKGDAAKLIVTDKMLSD